MNVMLNPIALMIAALFFTLAGCQAYLPITASQITRYNDADEAAAKEAMDESCGQYDKASRELLERAKALNRALDDELNKKSSKEEVDRMLKALNSAKPGEVERLDTACKQARATYGRILTVRADASQRAADINYEQARDAASARGSINCTSTKSGSTINTRCQ